MNTAAAVIARHDALRAQGVLQGGVWATRPVADEPEIRLVDWKVIAVEGQRHFVGAPRRGEGRVSSPIVEFDPATQRGVTRSGRVYQLAGESGFDLHAEYVLGTWLSCNGFTAEQVTDVTADVETAIAEAT